MYYALAYGLELSETFRIQSYSFLTRVKKEKPFLFRIKRKAGRRGQV